MFKRNHNYQRLPARGDGLWVFFGVSLGDPTHCFGMVCRGDKGF